MTTPLVHPRALGAARRLTGIELRMWLERVSGQWMIVAFSEPLGYAHIDNPADALQLVPELMRDRVLNTTGSNAVHRCCAATEALRKDPSSDHPRVRTMWFDLFHGVKATQQVLAVIWLHAGHGSEAGLTTHGVCRLYPEKTLTTA